MSKRTTIKISKIEYVVSIPKEVKKVYSIACSGWGIILCTDNGPYILKGKTLERVTVQ